MNIIDQRKINRLQPKFVPNGDGAVPTNRVLNGEWLQANCQEWVEHGTIDGIQASIYYIFNNNECGEDMDSLNLFIADNVHHIYIEK